MSKIKNGNSNGNLHSAKTAKNDEFYTQLTDIEKELRHYRDHFKGKTVLCNCDDPFESNFFKYFVLNFNRLGLKALMSTSYAGSAITEKEFEMNGQVVTGPYKAVVTTVRDADGDGAISMSDIEMLFRNGENLLEPLKGDGDFRSEEVVEMLKEADIVVTNPPFSLFREYVAQLVEYEKPFLVVGNKNAITYKETFSLIKEEKLWLGHTSPVEFYTPSGMTKSVNGLTRWFTNMDTPKRHEELILVRKYNPDEYPKYDNYDAINVDKVKDIPEDYFGVMGVPITFLDKYNPEQFDVLGFMDRQNTCGLCIKRYNKNDSPAYNDLNRGGAIWVGGVLKNTYMRIFIQRKVKE